MADRGDWLWAKTAAVFTAAGAALSCIHYYGARGEGGQLDAPVYFILSLGAGWLGALAGGLAAWRLHRVSPFRPMFRGRFGWHYRQRYWLRFATVFCMSWVLFVALCILIALAVGAYDEAMTFFTPEGAIAVFLFVAVFWVEGAVVGGLVDLVGHLSDKDRPGRSLPQE